MANFRFLGRYILIPVSFVFLLLSFYLVYKDIRSRALTEFSNEQLILAQTAARGMSSFFTEFKSDLDFLVSFDEVIEITDDIEKLLKKFYDDHREILSAVTRADSRGIIKYTYPRNELVIGTDITYQEHIRKIMATHEPVISDAFIAVQGYMAIAIHVPVFKGDKYDGSLALLIPIDRLGEMYLSNLQVRGDEESWLLSENGIALFGPYKEYHGKPFFELVDTTASSIEFINLIKNKTSGSAMIQQKMPARAKSVNEKFITFYRMPIGNTYWTIIISSDEKAIYESLTRLNNRLVGLMSLFLLIVIFYFYSIVKARNVLREENMRKKAEKTLRDSELKFRSLFDDHTAVKLLIDPENGSIIDANRSAAEYYGWSREELKNMNIDGIVLTDTDTKANMLKILNTQKLFFEFRNRRKDGSIRDTEAYCSKINISGKVMLHCIIHDITDRKMMENELIISKERAEESDRLKTAFLQNMSHEIRTPMNAIMGFSSLIADYYDDKPKLQKFGQIINSRCTDLLEIINGILDISKIESGQFTVKNEDCNLNEFFSEIGKFLDELRVRAGKQHLSFTVRPDCNAINSTITTDKVKLRQIFINLVSNAFKFTHEGYVEAGCKTDENNHIVFYVSDTGIGIPAAKHNMIFQRFVQIHNTGGYSYGGTGLGLAIVKGLVDLLHGKIWFESEEGKGTIFYFQFVN